MLDKAQHRGRLLTWLHGQKEIEWGTRPSEYQPEAVRQTLDRAGVLFGPGRYFGLDARGLKNVPSAPTMVVSNHSGGTSVPDVWGFLVAWYRHFGVHRPIHPMSHEIILSTKLTGTYFGRRGILQGRRAIAMEVLRTWRRDLLVMPGGDLDVWRPWSRRYKVCFAGRTGYARLAIQAGAPIVPVANAGAHETLIVLTEGRRIARALRLHTLARADIFPIHLSLPWGLAVGPWPHLPIPKRLRYRFGAPIPPPVRVAPGEEPPEEAVHALDRQVQAAVQALLDELRDEA